MEQYHNRLANHSLVDRELLSTEYDISIGSIAIALLHSMKGILINYYEYARIILKTS